MKTPLRNICDRIFTGMAALSAGLLCMLLVVILGPMIRRGAGAVFFKGTVEFRKMQLAMHGRGNRDALEAEAADAESARSILYGILEDFKQGIDTERLQEKANQIYRRFGTDLRQQDVSATEYTQLRSASRDIRNRLQKAFESRDRATIENDLDYVLGLSEDARFAGTAVAELFTMARSYRRTIKTVDLQMLEKYTVQLDQIEELVGQLLGPRPGEQLPALTMHRYGATRWDQAQRLLDRIIWSEEWVQKEKGLPLVKVRHRRAEQFAETPLEGLFAFVEERLPDMLKPRRTFYWRYFIDGSIPGHYFGGVGPEIVGTLVLTILSMACALPFGVVSAAYLAECASDNLPIRIIRMCINSLAGVPSIVFGLFGLAFFVLYIFPVFGLPSKPCILAGSLTLAILTLPVIIRASEEAIRSVPLTYKEASLAMGASKFRTFITVILPAAMPGILTGVILSLSRVAGETAPVLFTCAVALGPLPKSLMDPTRTLSYGSYDIAVGDRLAMMVPHQQYGMVMTLILLILFLNAASIMLRSRIFKKLQGRS